MTKMLRANNFIGRRRPQMNGQRLADEVLREDPETWSHLVIDARGCLPEDLVSALFNSFWQRVFEQRPDRMTEAKAIRWEFAHAFQESIFDQLRTRFRPRQSA